MHTCRKIGREILSGCFEGWSASSCHWRNLPSYYVYGEESNSLFLACALRGWSKPSALQRKHLFKDRVAIYLCTIYNFQFYYSQSLHDPPNSYPDLAGVEPVIGGGSYRLARFESCTGMSSENFVICFYLRKFWFLCTIFVCVLALRGVSRFYGEFAECFEAIY